MRKFFVLLCFLLLAGAGGTFFLLKKAYVVPGPLRQDTAVLVHHGDHARIINTLQHEGVIPQGALYARLTSFFIFLTKKDGQLHAAELLFPAHTSIKQTLSVLRHGRPIMHKLTIPEGLSAAQIQALINNASFLSGHITRPGEGSVLPQTYLYLRNTSRDELLKRTQEAMTHAVEKIWEDREADEKIPDKNALITLASLIEKETSVPSERSKVAGVFLNRLHKGMKLQTDPAVIFALTNGLEPLDRPLTHADLQIESPYNTYLHKGLPPGPVCSPGFSSLYAAAHPAKSSDLYFMATGEGGHNFTNDLKEHNKNVENYYRNKRK